ncbi:amidohydrolase [bacterium]|nr:MAG: amidohydrolase [bacterium]
MRKRILMGILVLFLVGGSRMFAGQTEKADLIIKNGKVFTANDAQPWAEAVACNSGKIIEVGTGRDIDRLVGPATRVLDVQGRLVIPGLIDAHTHFSSGGRSLVSLSFRGVNTIAKVQEMVTAKIKELPPGALVSGSEYDHTLFPGGNWPTKEDLDKVSPDNPVVIRRVDGHSIWVNSQALKRSGITRDTKDPFGGEILRNPKTGEPMGILTEAATGMVKVRGEEVKSTPERDILRALEHAAALGLTGVHTDSDLIEIKLYNKLKAEGRLSLRVYAWLPAEGLDSYIRKGIHQGQGDDMVRVGFQKVFIDGTLGSGTALMFAPFSDEPGKSGLPQMPEAELDALFEKAQMNGYQTGTHAIGDKGVNWVLNAVERARRKFGTKDLRHRIEHAQIIVPADVPRFKELGVIASMQPTHCTTDMRFCEQRVGKERSKSAYIWRTLLENGAKIAFGSDWPVEPLDPMRGLYSAVTRKNIEGDFPEGGWFPEQRLTMEEAVKLFTSGSAYASIEENIKGTLEPGKLADMVVLTKDLFTIPPREILTTEAAYTILGGRIVFEKK